MFLSVSLCLCGSLELVRQVRLELTIPCLRGRCLDPIWLLTHGGTERTRTVIGLIDNQVPHLSATVPEHLRLAISDCRFVVRRGAINRQSQITNELGGSKGVEPSLAAVTVRCSAN